MDIEEFIKLAEELMRSTEVECILTIRTEDTPAKLLTEAYGRGSVATRCMKCNASVLADKLTQSLISSGVQVLCFQCVEMIAVLKKADA